MYCIFYLIVLQNKGSRSGAPTVLSPEMETAFSRHLMDLADSGFGLTRRLVKVKAADFARKAGIEHPFKDGPAGDTWFRKFMRRHPQLSLRSPSKLCTLRGRAMDRKVVEAYFSDVENCVQGMSKEQIWNMDETGFNSEHVPCKIVCKKKKRKKRNEDSELACLSRPLVRT